MSRPASAAGGSRWRTRRDVLPEPRDSTRISAGSIAAVRATGPAGAVARATSVSVSARTSRAAPGAARKMAGGVSSGSRWMQSFASTWCQRPSRPTAPSRPSPREVSERRATVRLSGVQILVEYLVRQRVPYAVGIPGHGSWALTDALLDRADAIRTLQVMHEQSAVHLADGYYRVTG